MAEIIEHNLETDRVKASSKFFDFFKSRSVDEIIKLETNQRKLHESRGYYINVKQVILAFLMEFIIIAVSLVGNYYLALQTAILNEAANALNAITRDATFMLGMLSPVAFAVVETARVPLALSFRTHKSKGIKILSALGLICSIGITTKTMISINQQVYEPRRAEVTKLKSELNIANSRVATATETQSEALKNLKEKRDRVEGIENQILSKQRMLTTCGDGVITKQVGDETVTQNICVQNKSSIADVKRSLAADIEQQKLSRVDQTKADDEYNKAVANVKQVSLEKISAEERYQIAIRASQLHSLASIFFSKDITQVEESEVSYILQFLVYIPALLIAISSTLVAITAVHSIRPLKENRILHPEGAEQFILGPLTKTIVEKIKNDLSKAQSQIDTEISNGIKEVTSDPK